MGVEFYFYSPKRKAIYEVGKWSNWEYFGPFLKWLHEHTGWVLLDEHQYDWYSDEEQTVDIEIENDHMKLDFPLTIPKDVRKFSCFDDEFKQKVEQWHIMQEERRKKLERWRQEDEAAAKINPEEKVQHAKEILRAMEEEEKGDGVMVDITPFFERNRWWET